MLKIDNICKTFNPGTINEKRALNGVTLHLKDGESVAVIGGNGAGKSTLLNAVAGVWPVDSGTISIQTDPSTQIPNPFVECGTLAEAQDQAGFSLTLPDGCTPGHISVLPDQMIQVLCEDNLTIRKAVGQEDNSGDYTAYPQVDTLSSHGTEVTLKGDGDTVKVAVWTTEGYTYAIQSAAGLSRDAMLTLVASVA